MLNAEGPAVVSPRHSRGQAPWPRAKRAGTRGS